MAQSRKDSYTHEILYSFEPNYKYKINSFAFCIIKYQKFQLRIMAVKVLN